MKISTKGRYAVRLMLDVAIHGMDKNVSMRDVAERQNISIKYLEQIVSILTRVGYLKSVRGAQGGYRLTKAPSEYTIGDILRTTEGTLSPVSCLEVLKFKNNLEFLRVPYIIVYGVYLIIQFILFKTVIRMTPMLTMSVVLLCLMGIAQLILYGAFGSIEKNQTSGEYSFYTESHAI